MQETSENESKYAMDIFYQASNFLSDIFPGLEFLNFLATREFSCIKQFLLKDKMRVPQ